MRTLNETLEAVQSSINRMKDDAMKTKMQTSFDSLKEIAPTDIKVKTFAYGNLNGVNGASSPAEIEAEYVRASARDMAGYHSQHLADRISELSLEDLFNGNIFSEKDATINPYTEEPAYEYTMQINKNAEGYDIQMQNVTGGYCDSKKINERDINFDLMYEGKKSSIEDCANHYKKEIDIGSKHTTESTYQIGSREEGLNFSETTVDKDPSNVVHYEMSKKGQLSACNHTGTYQTSKGFSYNESSQNIYNEPIGRLKEFEQKYNVEVSPSGEVQRKEILTTTTSKINGKGYVDAVNEKKSLRTEGSPTILNKETNVERVGNDVVKITSKDIVNNQTVVENVKNCAPDQSVNLNMQGQVQQPAPQMPQIEVPQTVVPPAPVATNITPPPMPVPPPLPPMPTLPPMGPAMMM